MSIAIDLSGQVVLVTGATGGIGRGIARRFHAAGATVAIHHRARPDEAASLAAELPGSFVVSGDVTDPDARIVDQVVAEAGKITGPSQQRRHPAARRVGGPRRGAGAMIDTNLTAAHRLSQAAAAHMTEGGWITHTLRSKAPNPPCPLATMPPRRRR